MNIICIEFFIFAENLISSNKLMILILGFISLCYNMEYFKIPSFLGLQWFDDKVFCENTWLIRDFYPRFTFT